jgi:hypothetical protein
MVVELAVLLACRAFTGRGLPPLQVFTAVGAGAALFLALRFALADPPQAGPIALFLMLALVTHLLDLRARWRSRRE